MRRQSTITQFAIVLKQQLVVQLAPGQLDEYGIPTDLSSSGHHFFDLPGWRQPQIVLFRNSPMRAMRNKVAIEGLKHPTVNKYTKRNR
ncbi:LOW QUALITY PROTEIN: hypothetical protein ACHAW6_009129 [Cyclotella cf. meneghiniana]